MIVGVIMPKQLFGTAVKKKTRKFFFRYGSIAPASASIDAHNQIFIETKVQTSILITTKNIKKKCNSNIKKTRKLYNQFRILEIVPNDVASRNAGINFSLSIEV
jgi:hypothetical protein